MLERGRCGLGTGLVAERRAEVVGLVVAALLGEVSDVRLGIPVPVS